ncbi:helix-turn-helix transcriptional regulator [Dactylosporangium roseum]|uniref:Helix-turn-helix transcriptional regulator n=1 Tax=Dactylosporangium roseum TaxID=47989 RepID=A0ABY5ZB61_9ACTN|nr:helix-turn-helix transcriptional regulator [Dactylosporangium roseum]UWZ37938.1 helix-turn-helix transcriptional regulator [Dactylosporangium roseum]
MRVTKTSAPSHSDVPKRLAFNGQRFNEAMRERGYTTETARAEAAGVTTMTLNRWRRGRFAGTPARASQAARAAGLTVDELFPAAAEPTMAKAA